MQIQTSLQWIDIAMMFGFAKISGGNVDIANRIFEVRLYNYFLATAEAQSSNIGIREIQLGDRILIEAVV